MLDLDIRTAILEMKRRGLGIRAIARSMKLSRNSVRTVLMSGQPKVPVQTRDLQLAPHIDRVNELHRACRGNLVRVWEELGAAGIEVGYSSLTTFCRSHSIGKQEKRPAGRYDFPVGLEMQHDTSPHVVEIGGVKTKLQCALLVFAYSTCKFGRLYPRWRRFECRLFLNAALRYFGGSCERCIVDNSSVILASGSGADAIPAAIMKAQAERYGFHFVAHAVGDANRSAKVERPFYHVETNFYPGRQFEDLTDANGQFETWLDRVNRRPKRGSKLSPFELLEAERSALKSMPLYIPEVYDLHVRRVGVDGYVTLSTNRYSVPSAAIGRQLELREGEHSVRVFDNHVLVAEHPRQQAGAYKRVTLPEHRYRAQRRRPMPPSKEEELLGTVAPEFGELIARLRKRHGGQALKSVRKLQKLYFDYDTKILITAIARALKHDLISLERIERMVLQQVAGEFFRLPVGPEDEE